MKPLILESSYSELVELIGSLGEPKYRADQILKWIWEARRVPLNR